MKNELVQYRSELTKELESILAWWRNMTIDEENGGFVGKIDHFNTIFPQAPKGSVLNSRILWAFSSAYNLSGGTENLVLAKRAFHYIADHFIDKDFGGVYWTVDYKGTALDTKKQIYALAFAIYGLTEYFIASHDENALELALDIYQQIISRSYEEEFGGYIEALSRDWSETGDLRLSAKDANERKTMNTHLHVLEAFANLYKTWIDQGLKSRLVELIRLFLDHIIDKHTNHLVLFFDDRWNRRSNIISYGHDIEAAWLLQEAAEIIGERGLVEETKRIALKIAEAASEGLDEDGGLWYEMDLNSNHLIDQKHAWPQAEAMIGFFNAWQITGEEKFLQQSLRSWNFVKEFILDKNGGEWFWGVNADHSPMLEQEKLGIWKCPYHSSRACIQLITRIDHVLNEKI